MIELRVEFDDGDWLFTRFNGTTDEAEDYYFGRVFTDRDERPRRVTGLQFLTTKLNSAALGDYSIDL